MPLRTRVKRAFTRSSNSSADSTPSTTTPSSNTDLTTTTTLTSTPTSSTLNKTHTDTSTKSSKTKKFRLFRRTTSEWDDWPDHLYKPHEVPPPKYKRVPAKEHTEHLEAYSFASAVENFRRRSATSLYSPMGSRMPSISSRAGVSGPDRSRSIATESVAGHVHDDGTDAIESSSGNMGVDTVGSEDKTSILGGGKTPAEPIIARPTTLITRQSSALSSASATSAATVTDGHTASVDQGVPPGTLNKKTNLEPQVCNVRTAIKDVPTSSPLRMGITA